MRMVESPPDTASHTANADRTRELPGKSQISRQVAGPGTAQSARLAEILPLADTRSVLVNVSALAATFENKVATANVIEPFTLGCVHGRANTNCLIKRRRLRHRSASRNK